MTSNHRSRVEPIMRYEITEDELQEIERETMNQSFALLGVGFFLLALSLALVTVLAVRSFTSIGLIWEAGIDTIVCFTGCYVFFELWSKHSKKISNVIFTLRKRGPLPAHWTLL